MEQIKKALEVLEAQLDELREELDRQDANHAGAQVAVKQEITELLKQIKSVKRLLSPEEK